MKLVFWQNIVSPHQAGFMRALAERGHEVTAIARERMSAGRHKLGWEPPPLGPARLVVGPSPADIVRLVREGPADAIHCIAGARVDMTGTVVARECRAARRRMGIITETPDPRGLGGVLRWGKYTVERLTIGGSFDFVLAMGETGMRWFRRCGYPADRLYPFAYVTDIIAPGRQEEHSGPYRCLFVGRLVDLKGVDVLLKAVSQVPGVALDVIGDGPLRGRLDNLAQGLGLSGRVRWLGQLPPAEIPSWLVRADLLVLPSRKDGWGAVVNEALMLGTPVVSSSACGASDLLQHDWLGSVVRPGDLASLREAILSWANREQTAVARQRIRDWARCVTGESIAGYLEAVLRHAYEGEPRPVAPWRMQA